MRCKKILPLALALVAVAMLAAVPRPAGAEEGAGLGVELTLEPLENHEDGITCTAVITHLGSGEVLTAPTIRFLRGERGSVTSETTDGALVRFTVEVDKEGRHLSYRAEYLRDEKVLASQKATLRLDLG